MFSSIKDFINDKKFSIHILDNCININNYQDIITLEENRITVSSTRKMIIIKGNHLSITKLLDNEIVITGEYKEVLFNEI